jgi:hypothetical protein
MKKIKIRSDGTNKGTRVTIGKQVVPVNNMLIRLNKGEPVSVVLEVSAEFMDITVLAENTDLAVRAV